MRTQKTYYFVVLFMIICTTNLNIGEGLSLSEVLVTISEKTDYTVDLDPDLGANGRFTLILSSLDTSKTAVFFTYRLSSSVLFQGSNTNITTDPDPNLNIVNGTLEPGDTIEVGYYISECVADAPLAISFMFIPIMNSTAVISIDMVIEEYGEDTCPPQIGPDFSNMFLPFWVIILVVIILLIFRYIRTRNGN